MAEKTPAKKSVAPSGKKVDPRTLKTVSGGGRISGNQDKANDAVLSKI